LTPHADSALLAGHLRFKDVKQMRESTLKRFLRQPHFDELLELHRLAGYAPGPAFQQILREVEDAQLEGRIQTREEALAMVRARFGPPQPD
jgi:poly(A) polymerase